MLLVAGLVAVVLAEVDWTIVVDRYGLPLAALLVVFVGGAKFLVPGWVHQRALDDLDREREIRETLETVLRDDVVPALVRSTEATARASSLLERVERRLDRTDRP